MAIPGIRHLRNEIVIPISSTSTARMMGNLPDRNRGVTVLTKPSWQRGRNLIRSRLQLLGPFEQRRIAGRSIAPRQQGETRSSTGGSLHIMLGECPTARCQRVDVRRLDVIDPEAFQLRAQIIDANQQHVRFLQGKEVCAEGEENGENRNGVIHRERGF